MPTDTRLDLRLDTSNMLTSLRTVQRHISRLNFSQLGVQEQHELYASLFACRSTVHASTGATAALRQRFEMREWEKERNELLLSPTFLAYIQSKNQEDLRRLMLKGHGSAAERDFIEYVMKQEKLPTDVPSRYMPSAMERIEQQQKKLESLPANSKQAANIYAEIFRSRRAVGAVRNTPSSLERTIYGSEYANQPDLTASKTFQEFVQKKGTELKASLTGRSHGGAAEDLYKDYVLQLDALPADVPSFYMPQALERTEVLQKKLKATADPAQRKKLLNEIMATRSSVNAVAGSKDSLRKTVNSENLQSALTGWQNCKTFQDYLENHETEAAEAAASDQGGGLAAKFRAHVATLDHIPADVPPASMPQALDHVKAIQAKYGEPSYFNRSKEQKLALAAELMAAREAVGAEGKDEDSLKKPLSQSVLQASYQKWTKCKAFQEFIEKDHREVYDGVTKDYGHSLSVKFKNYVVQRDRLDADIPDEYMPTARVRIESLQEKLRSAPQNPADSAELYAELMASRSSVNAVRKKAGTLDVRLSAEELNREREQLLKSPAFQRFLKDPAKQEEIRKAAREGHGGALEDSFQEYVKTLDKIPANVPARYLPSGLERANTLKERLTKDEFDSDAERIDAYVELLATRDSVNAVRGKEKSLDKPIDPAALDSARSKWRSCKTFTDFVSKEENLMNYSEVQKAATSGHGGALVDKFKEHCKNLIELPADVGDLPVNVLPMGDERLKALQDKLIKGKDDLSTEEKTRAYAQLLATRCFVGATKDEESLKKPLDPAAINESAKKLASTPFFQNFVRRSEAWLDDIADQKYGAEAMDRFKYYVAGSLNVPEDLPADYLPTAKERIEALQNKIRNSTNPAYENWPEDVKTSCVAEILAARRSVNAQRGKEDSLNPKLDLKKSGAYAQQLKDSDTFKTFLKENPELVKESVTSGHAGKLEDKFQAYVLNLPRIPGDVPKEYMPTAQARIEVLKKRISENAATEKNYDKLSQDEQYSIAAKQNTLYQELMATRAAVNSIRGDKSSLDHPIDPAVLDATRMGLVRSDGVKEFLAEGNRDELRSAALSGHGGALEDKLKASILQQSSENGVLPNELPDRYKPSCAQLREKLRAGLQTDYVRLSSQDFDKPETKTALMKRVAASMYLSKLEAEARSKGEAVPVLNEKEMETQVNRLVSSRAFKGMFSTPEAARRIVGQVGNKHLSEVFGEFSSRGGKLELGKEAELQRQNELQRRNSVRQQERPQELQNEQNRRRARSFAEPRERDRNLSGPQL